MKNKSTRNQKLKNYSVMAGAMATAVAANAQVMYTDVNPDQTFTTGNSYLLNMNNDGTGNEEFVITCDARSGSVSGASYTGVGVAVTTIGSGAAVIAHTGSALPINYVDTLGFGTMIDNTGNFLSAGASSGSSALIMGAVGTVGGFFPFAIGDWLGVSNKYMGVKFSIATVNHYGWARFAVGANADQFTIKDYAYDATADQPIAAGDNASSINELNLRDELDMNISNDQLLIHVRNTKLTNGVVNIVSITGQVVATFNLNNSTVKYDVSAFTSGVYVIQVNFDQGMATEKLFIR